MAKAKNIFGKMFNPMWGFDFKVSVTRHIVSVAPGKQISIPVRVEKIRGKRQPVKLDVNTNWESVGLTAKLTMNELVPDPEWSGAMMIRASAKTPPGSYLFTVRGGAEGTFHTSEDAVTVIVDPEAEQKTDEDDNVQPRHSKAEPDASVDPSDIFKPKVKVPEPAKKPGASAHGNSAGIWFTVIFVGIVIMIIVIMMNMGGTVRRCVGTFSLDCSDNNGQPERTIVNGRDIGVCRGITANGGCIK